MTSSDEAVEAARENVRWSILSGAGQERIDRAWVDFAAAVRAEVVAEHAADLRHRIEVSTKIEADRRLALAERDEYHRNWQAAEKRTAEAVADERQRIADALASHGARLSSDPTKLRGMTTVEHAVKVALSGGDDCNLRSVAAGPVPVATPEPPSFDELLADPYEQFDRNSVLLPLVLDADRNAQADALNASIREYQDAKPATATAPVANPPAEPVSFQRGGDAATTVAPSQPVTCEHGVTVGHWDCSGGPRVHWPWCLGPVSEPKEPAIQDLAALSDHGGSVSGG